MTILNPDEVSRSDLALIDDGRFSSLQDARAYLSSFQPVILVGPASCSSLNAQAATHAAATTAIRAFGGAAAFIPSATPNLWPGSPASTFAEAIEAMGAELVTEPVARRVCILIGDVAIENEADYEIVLRVTWSSWSGMVTPGHDARRLIEDDHIVLAPIVAAGIAMSELFEVARGRITAGERELALNLWTLETGATHEGPQIGDVPAAWWLVGLGHLGQASAWILSWLPKPSSKAVVVTIQDDESLVAANLSTSLCALPADLGRPKARVVSALLESAGYETKIIERRLDAGFVVSPADQQVALFGVDNPETRRAISNHGWPLAIDVGLGSGAVDFGAISLHVFPGSTNSHEVDSWREATPGNRSLAERRLEGPGFKGLLETHDVCGVEVLAGVNVAASFVGLVSGCLSISEAIRRSLGGKALDSIGVELWDIDPLSNPSQTPSVPLTLRLRR